MCSCWPPSSLNVHNGYILNVKPTLSYPCRPVLVAISLVCERVFVCVTSPIVRGLKVLVVFRGSVIVTSRLKPTNMYGANRANQWMCNGKNPTLLLSHIWENTYFWSGIHHLREGGVKFIYWYVELMQGKIRIMRVSFSSLFTEIHSFLFIQNIYKSQIEDVFTLNH